MKRAMITVCGDFSGRDNWISDIMLTSVAKLSSALGQNDYEVAYANAMDNIQIINPTESVVRLSQKADADILFVTYRDLERKNNLYATFNRLRELLPRHIALVLIDIGNIDALTKEQKILLSQLRGLYFLHGIKGTDKETVKILLRDIALGV